MTNISVYFTTVPYGLTSISSQQSSDTHQVRFTAKKIR